MTKEELEKEAEDYAEKHAFRVPYDGSNNFYDDVDFKASKEAYLAGAEPREKRIAELETRCNELFLQTCEQAEKIAELEVEVVRLRNENLDIINKYTRFAETDKRTIADLEAQIEKMKNCRNCKNEKIEGACGHFTQVGWCKNWELED